MKYLKLIVFILGLTFATSCGQQKRFLEYKVKEGETMRSIAKQYNLKTRDLLRLNPDVGRKPKPNTVIIIPNSKTKSTEVSTDKEVIKTVTESEDVVKVTNDTEVTSSEADKELEELKKNFVIHKVKAKETIYGLTRFYNITEKGLFALNPSVEKEGLKFDQYIKIRPITSEEDEIANEVFEDNFTAGSIIKVALLLPFRASEHKDKDAKELFSKNMLANIVTDFYMGSEIAIDSLKKQGVNVDVKVFDTGKKSSKINAIAQDDYLDEADVVIGPFYYEEAKVVANEVKSPVVFPMYSKNQRTLNSSKIVKTSPNKNSYLEALTDYLSETYNGENIIVVGDGKATSNKKVNSIVNNLKKNDSITKIHVIKPEKGYIKKEKFTDIMLPKTNSWVIITSDENVAVADALNSMIALPEEVKAQVFAIEKNKAFNRIDNFKLALINFGYVTNEYIDESAFATQVFNKKYKKLNNTLPSNYATKGFDITYDILARLASSDNDLKATFKEGSSYRLVTKFDYDKSLFGATKNKGLFIVKYNNDLSLTRLR